MTRLRSTLIALGGVAAGAVAYQTLARPRIRHWGSEERDRQRFLPGDELVAEPQTVTTRAISIKAPPAAVWPWLAQMGQKRGGFYSYDGLERLVGLDIHNADRVHPEWQDIATGDKVYLSPKSPMIVAEIVPEETLVLFQEATIGGGADDVLRWSWCFHLEPVGTRRARLLVRTRVNWTPDGLLGLFLSAPVEAVHFVMERGMLQGLKERAEMNPTPRRSPSTS